MIFQQNWEKSHFKQHQRVLMNAPFYSSLNIMRFAAQVKARGHEYLKRKLSSVSHLRTGAQLRQRIQGTEGGCETLERWLLMWCHWPSVSFLSPSLITGNVKWHQLTAVCTAAVFQDRQHRNRVCSSFLNWEENTFVARTLCLRFINDVGSSKIRQLIKWSHSPSVCFLLTVLSL